MLEIRKMCSENVILMWCGKITKFRANASENYNLICEIKWNGKRYITQL